jgi:hypothetical protein
MIGGCVGVAVGTGVSAPGDALEPGDGAVLGDSVAGTGWAGGGVTTAPGGFTGPDDGGGTGGFTCAAAASAAAIRNARLVNGARTRRKRLPIQCGDDYAIFCSAGSRETADANSVL